MRQTLQTKLFLRDADPHFRVWNSLVGVLTNDGYTVTTTKSIGGYHGAKLQRYQTLLTSSSISKIWHALICSMPNTLLPRETDNKAQRNPNACGNAWSVNTVNIVANADAEMAALSSFNPKNSAIVDTRFSGYLGNKPTFAPAKLKLTSYDPKYMEYSFEGGDAFVVFSEIYYEGSGNDWQAYLDGAPIDHIRVNYTLRGIKVPEGKHEIVFEFKPDSTILEKKVNMAGSAILFYSYWPTLGGRRTKREKYNPNKKYFNKTASAMLAVFL